MFKQFSKPQGQAMVLWALLTPIFILFLGVGMDLGWYYLNVSRLQNAADAAALAGAQALVKNNNAFKDYYIVALAENKLPEDFDHYENVYTNISSVNSGNNPNAVLKNYKTAEEVQGTLLDGRALVEEYTRKNLSDFEEIDTSITDQSNVSAKDGWAHKKADNLVKGTIEIKYNRIDGKNDVYGSLYYVVNLTEKVRHFFLPGWFDDMDAPVRSVVLLLPHNEGLITPIQVLERTMVIDNWEDQNKNKLDRGGKWNHYMAEDKKAIKYSDGNVYRTESVRVKTTRGGDSDGRITSANNPVKGTFYDVKDVDSINLDFQAEVRVKGTLFTSDWDLGMEIPNFNGYAQTDNDSWGVGNGDDKRILYNVEFNEAFKTRDASKEADILWTRIESDPIIPQKKYDTDKVTIIDVPLYNSVRQITLNFNSNNTATYDSGENKGHYKYRPYFIFYTGPENIDREQGWKVRHSQPVVLNLNEDLNAIIYMPNSPVVINGNEHTWHGFIIARCFLHSVTSEDMTGEKPFTLYDGFDVKGICPGGYSEGTDSNGYTVYFKSDKLVTRNKINETHKNDEVIEDLTKGNITVKEKINVTRCES